MEDKDGLEIKYEVAVQKKNTKIHQIIITL